MTLGADDRVLNAVIADGVILDGAIAVVPSETSLAGAL